MKLLEPFIISARLLPALRIGMAYVQLHYSKRAGRDGRTRYRWIIDLADGREFTGDDLQSGAGGGNLQSGFSSLLAFLSACAESFSYRERTGSEGENIDLFPLPVAEWAAQNSDEISILQCEIEESGKALIDE